MKFTSVGKNVFSCKAVQMKMTTSDCRSAHKVSILEAAESL